MSSLEELRQSLDQIDAEIVTLLEKRFQVTDQVAVVKNEQNIPVTDAGREQRILDTLRDQASHPVLKETIGDLYRLIFRQNKTARIFRTHTIQPFSRVGIIGLGMIGGSIVKALKMKEPKIAIHTIERKSEDLERAVKNGYISMVHGDISELVANCDLIILATPIAVTQQIAQEIAQCKPNSSLIVIDVASVKEKISQLFETLTTDTIEFCGTHPMGGSEKTGFIDADGLLFVNKPWIITPHSKTNPSTQEKLEQLISFMGASPIGTTAPKHDELVAAGSHIVFLLSCYIYKFMAEAHPDALAITGSGFESMTRLASGSPQMHTQIIQENFTNVTTQIANFVQFLENEKLSPESLQEFFTTIKTSRDTFMAERGI